MNKQITRKTVRLPEYDYRRQGYYFVTIVTKNREFLMGDILNGTVVYKKIGTITSEQIEKIPQRYQSISVDKYVVMPNHVHVILRFEKSETVSLGSVIGKFKAGVSREAGCSIWQRGYYDHVIRDKEDYNMIWQYIENNPLKWELDRFHG